MIIASSSAHLSFKETLKTFPGAGMSGSGVREPWSKMSRLVAGIFSSPPPCQSPWGQKYLWAILTGCRAYLEGWWLRLPGPGWALGVRRKCDLRTLFSLWICQALIKSLNQRNANLSWPLIKAMNHLKWGEMLKHFEIEMNATLCLSNSV